MELTRVLIRAPSLLIISMVICIRMNWKLSITFLVAIPTLLAVVLIIMKFTTYLLRLCRPRSTTSMPLCRKTSLPSGWSRALCA